MTLEQKIEVLEKRLAKLENEQKDCYNEYRESGDKLFIKFAEWKEEEIREVRSLLVNVLLGKNKE